MLKTSHIVLFLFSNLINQGVTSHSKIKTLRISDWGLVRTSKKRNTRHEKTNMDKRRLKIIPRVLEEVKSNFSEATQFIEDCLEQECLKENTSVDEVNFLFTSLEAKS